MSAHQADASDHGRMTAPNVETPPDTWAQLLSDITSGLTGRVVIDRAARIAGDAPLGEATRLLLAIWSRYSGPVSGGSFRQRHGGGFGIGGDRHEAFLSHVCGADPERQRAVLEDIKAYPEHAELVYQRIIELGSKATEDLPRIGGMAIGGGMGRDMFRGMCMYLVNLADVAKAVRAAPADPEALMKLARDAHERHFMELAAEIAPDSEDGSETD